MLLTSPTTFSILPYSLGLYYTKDADTTFSPFFVLMRAITCSLKALSGDFQASAASELAKDNSLFAIAIFFHFIAAEILTFLIIIKLFGKNLINRFNIFINSLRAKYIVVGISKQTEVFLNSFNRKKRRRTTIVLEAKHKDRKRDLMFKGFAVVVVKENDGKPKRNASKKDITKEILDALKIAGFNKNRKKTRIISMSESDETNLLIAKIVTDYIADIIKPTKNEKGYINRLKPYQEDALEKINLFAHIMYKSLERAEHFAFCEYALGKVRFFNPYEVRARKFMIDNPITSLIPKQWINIEKARLYNATDEGHFRPYRIGNIFVGYGYANRYILKKSICNNQLLGTDYNALIIDKEAKKLEMQFQNAASGLFNFNKDNTIIYGSELKPNLAQNLYYPNPEESYNIAFADLDVLSSNFYNRIVQEIVGIDGKDGLDFATIIIALGNDKLSIETALELRQKLYERKLLRGTIDGDNEPRIRIFVKISEESVLSNYSILNDKNDIDSEILVFGTSNEILNEEYIVHEKLDFIAKRIANEYWKSSGAENQKTNIVSKWDSLTEFKRDANRYAAMSIRTKLNLLGYELCEGIGKTDACVIREYEDSYGIEISKWQRAEKSGGKFIDFAQYDNAGNILDNARNNLARLEHQRWNTLHLLGGWTKLAISEVTATKRQDEKAKQHACITTFEGLSNLRYRQADCAIKAERMSNNEEALEKALSEADTVCYDFDVMDRLFGNLENSNYIVKKKVR